MGSSEFKSALVEDHSLVALSRAWETGGAREVNDLKWSGLLRIALAALRKTEAEMRDARESAPWKLAIATWLKTCSQAANRRLAERLFLGGWQRFPCGI